MVDGEEPDMRQMVESLDTQDPDWQFLMKYCHCLSFRDLRGEVDEESLPDYYCGSTEYASLILTYCRHRIFKPSFSYLDLRHASIFLLFSKDVVPLLRGIPEVHTKGISMPADIDDYTAEAYGTEFVFDNIRGVKTLNHEARMVDLTYNCLASLRGVEHLTLHNLSHKLPQGAFDNLRGVRTFRLLKIRGTIMGGEMLRNLRGVEELTVDGDFKLDSLELEKDLQNLRGILQLNLRSPDSGELTDNCFESFRGIKSLRLSNANGIYSKLTDASFQNLRGIQELELITNVKYELITDSAFINLRGVKKLKIRNFPQITSAIFENLRGIDSLNVCDCVNLSFTSEALHNLRGIQHLGWWSNVDNELNENFSGNMKPLKDECTEHLDGVKHLFLNNDVTVSDSAFRHFRKTRYLHLRGTEDLEVCQPVSDAAFSHMSNMETLYLIGIRLENVSSFPHLIETMLPKLHTLDIRDCYISQKCLKNRTGRRGITCHIEFQAGVCIERGTECVRADLLWERDYFSPVFPLIL